MLSLCGHTVRDVKSFLGKAPYYKKLIPDISTLAYPLTKPSQDDKPFIWGEEQQQAFEEIGSDPVLL